MIEKGKRRNGQLKGIIATFKLACWFRCKKYQVSLVLSISRALANSFADLLGVQRSNPPTFGQFRRVGVENAPTPLVAIARGHQKSQLESVTDTSHRPIVIQCERFEGPVIAE